MSNQLPRECQVIKLGDYMGCKYKVVVQRMGHKSKKINGPELIRFVESYKNKIIEKIKDGSGRDYVHGCLIQAEEETYYKQDLLKDLLWLLSDRRLKVENLLAKVHGPKQSCKFDVCYAFPPENEKELGAGFMRSGWATFCFENDIEENSQLLFQWMGSNLEDHFNFNVKIFNKDEIGLHVGAKHH
ncbi:putative DNA-binding pseudobarrel domain superfamily [Helianthus anomalus]